MEGYAQQVHRCFRCGYCKFTSNYADFNCPSYVRHRFDTYSTGGRLWLINAWQKGQIAWSDRLANILYTCTTCRNCVERCPMGFSGDIVEWIVGARADAVEQGRVPAAVRRFLESVQKYGNPLEMPPKDRAAWADGIKRYEPGDEYLFYVGCLGSYDEHGQPMAKAVAALLGEAGVSFGILGDEEGCCGNEAYGLGEMGLFRMLAESNIRKFAERGVKKVVTLSPHAYHTMKNNYRPFGAAFEVSHYSQLLYGLIKGGKVKPAAAKAKITYHDPCYLGRYNREYDAPRRVLRSIPGVELVEMPRSRDNAFCCGGGSGNFVMDLFGGGGESPGRLRVREAYQTGAEILAVACPACLVMFADAVKSEGLEGKLAVRDLAQVVKEAVATSARADARLGT